MGDLAGVSTSLDSSSPESSSAGVPLLKPFGESLPSTQALPSILDSFAGWVSAQPSATVAVDPGPPSEQLTYQELAQKSDRLAFHLRQHGVGPEVPVGLFMERSLDLLVALLAIWKAGGVYVPLDTMYPEDRLADVLDDADVALIVTHRNLRPPRGRRTRPTLLDLDLASCISDSETAPVESVSTETLPTSAAYMIFTSGSTGRPKGVTVSHGALSWYVATFGACYGITPQDSFLQFSSIGFDLALAEVTLPLTSGATLVFRTPQMSESISEFLRNCREWSISVLMPATAFWHELAAGIAKNPTALPPSLRLVSFGGETVVTARVSQWLDAVGRRVRLFNAYGPTEATIEATLYEYTERRATASIGMPVVGVQTLVLDRDGLPVKPGETGELCLAGPGLARGYSGRPVETAKHFVPLSLAATNQAGGRLYRTGDLARIMQNGCLQLVGRTDFQVKIRGVRVEPEEVEARLTAHPKVCQSCVVAREDMPGYRFLAAYVALAESGPIDQLVAELRTFLEATLPRHMVPTTFTFLPTLPLHPNGKIDRRALSLGLFSGQKLEQRRRPYATPRTPTERLLARIWEEILHVERIGLNDNIFELGGDSILNIQIVAKAREAGLKLSPKDLFHYPTLGELATVTLPADEVDLHELADPGPLTGPVPLTPIQLWFFEELRTADPHHFNQSVLLEVRRPLDPNVLEKSIGWLIEHHDGLRLRFCQKAGDWRQWIATLDSEIPLVMVDLSQGRRQGLPLLLRGPLNRLHSSLNLERGPILRVAYFDRGPLPGRLFIVVHHLAIDGVSWNILISDLESVYLQLEEGQEPKMPARTTSYKAWSERLRQHANAPETRRECDHWLQVPRKAPFLPIDVPGGDISRDNTQASVDRVVVKLGTERTHWLLRQVPAAYRTQINDVLLSALLLSFSRATGERSLLIELEGHGREDVLEATDLSRTVGWFTAAFPVFLEAAPEAGPGDVLKTVKETLRAIPRRGFGYFLLRYLSDDRNIGRELAALEAPRISFNYLSQADPLFARSTLFGAADEPTGERASRKGSRANLIEILAYVVEDRLWLSWNYSRRLHRSETIVHLAEVFIEELEALISHCLLPQAGGFTASDFPLAGLTTDQLKPWMESHRNIEDIYPLSPTQQGLLFHALYAPESAIYLEQNNWLLEGPLDTDVFRAAWADLVERHAILRTAFVWEGLERPLQIVYRGAPLSWHPHDWSRFDVTEQDRRIESLVERDRRRGFVLSQAPLMRLQLVRLGDERFRFIWSIHHLLLDGWSLSIVFAELLEIYDCLSHSRFFEKPRPRRFSDYIAWLIKNESAAEPAYWRQHLEGIQAPTPLPLESPSDSTLRNEEQRFRQEKRRLPPLMGRALNDFCRRRRLTLNTVIQGSWAILLARMSGESEVVFGTTVSGRPAELNGAECIVGLLVNTLPVRVRLDWKATQLTWLEALQEQNLQLRQHSYASLVDIQSWSDVPRHLPLFESLLGIQNYPGVSTLRESYGPLRFGDLRYFSQTNYPLLIEVLPEDEIELQVRYDPRRFEKTSIRRLLGHLQLLAESILDNPIHSLEALSLLTAGERHQVVLEWNDRPAAHFEPISFDHLLESLREERQDAVAFTWRGEDGCEGRLSFGELSDRAEVLATALERDLDPEEPVALLMDRVPELPVAFLAILKAGGIVLPLDPAYPEKRLAFVLADARAERVLTQARYLNRLPSAWQPRATILEMPASKNVPSRRRVKRSVERGAYMIYTSGSTGRPKGVVVSHHAFVHHMAWISTSPYRISSTDRLLLKTPLSFDAGLWEFGGALVAGACQVLARRGAERDPAEIAAALHRYQISYLQVVPTQLRTFLEASQFAHCSSLRWLCCGGEVLDGELYNRFLDAMPNTSLFNVYGPTEATMHVCSWVPPRAGGKDSARLESRIAIGRPIARSGLLLLDRALHAMPLGAVGELHLTGSGLARGYRARPALTASCFLPQPFGEHGGRMYRTGDLARHRWDGQLDFLGRADCQIKLRGMRVELGEIEAQLREQPGIADAVVTVPEPDGDPANAGSLVAYVVVDENTTTARVDATREAEHVRQWQTLYEDLHRQEIPQDGEEGFGEGFLGWSSSYDGRPLPMAEMREWLDETIARILALGPRNALEIGCGTGLILRGVAPNCEHYLGTDFSTSGMEYLQTRVRELGLWQVALERRLADDFEGLSTASYDTIILNSVVQYFPSVEYLLRVLRGAIELAVPGGSVFIGDVRNLALHEAYCASVDLFQAQPGWTCADLRDRIGRRRQLEEELLIHPQLFFAFAASLPRISGVTIRPKGGQARNELTRFRYDVTFHLAHPKVAQPKATIAVTPLVWLDWHRSGPDLDGLRQRLELNRTGERRRIGVRGVPDLRVRTETRLLELLGKPRDITSVADLRTALAASRPEGVDPEELSRLARDCGHVLELAGPAFGEGGVIDVVFRPADVAPATPLDTSRSAKEPAWSRWANRPVASRTLQRFIPELRRALGERLPAHMVPAHFVLLDSLPTLPNDKVDRRTLARRALPGDERPRGEAITAPRNSVEASLASIWSAVLGISEIGVEDNFFELGGHSLLATQMVSRIREALRLEVPLRRLFEKPTIAQLAASFADELGPEPPPILPASRGDEPPPLSFAQQRLWFLDRLRPGDPAFHMNDVWRLRGPLDLKALHAALEGIVDRHETLRTTFCEIDGVPRQIIAPDVELDLPIVDFGGLPGWRREAELARLAREEIEQTFDLERGPLLRVTLVYLGSGRDGSDTHAALLRTLHHVVSDGWSEAVFYRELVALYEALCDRRPSPLAPLAVQYADFAIWQRSWLRDRVLDDHLAYWRRALAGLVPLSLPSDRPRGEQEGATSRPAMLDFELDPDLSTGIKRLARDAGASLFMVLTAAWMVLLGRITGQTDIALGAPIANRRRRELEDLIGFFVNVLVLRGRLDGDPRFGEHLEQVKETALNAYAHQDLPFERLVEELAPQRRHDRNPLFQVAFAVHPILHQELRAGGLELRRIDLAERATVDLETHLWEAADRILGYTVYRPELSDGTRIRRWIGHFKCLLRDLVDRPEARLSQLDLLAPAEVHQLVSEWNDTAREPVAESLSALLRQQVRGRADAAAVTFLEVDGRLRGVVLSYAELDRRAERLATHLVTSGVRIGDRVGLLVERSAELVVGLLAVARAGAAFVPLDAAYPQARLQFMIEDAGVQRILTRADIADGSTVGSNRNGAGDTPAVLPHDDPDRLAYVIYTSGSTGRPKGVAIPHRGWGNLAASQPRLAAVEPGDRILQFSSPSFDAFIWELGMSLGCGATICLAPVERLMPGPPLRSTLATAAVHQVTLTPSSLAALGPPSAASLATVIVAGEACPPGLAARWSAGLRLLNAYGPTEATVCASVGRMRSASGRSSAPSAPIGWPIANVAIHVAGPRLELLPLGSEGELLISAPKSLAWGYLGRSRLTGERFIPNPWSVDAGERLYRTGDRVGRLPDGQLDFRGRLDQQIQLRGYRVEPGEVEAVLAGLEGIRDAVVTVRQGNRGESTLTAWVVADGDILPAPVHLAIEEEYVERWRSLYEDVYKEPYRPATDPFFGWSSSFTGEPIPKAEMEEWREATAARILELAPSRVLEIGCGTGLVLERVAPKTERYVGVDFSEKALDQLGLRLNLPQVELAVRSATDAGDLDPGGFDTVVLNSVVQYFPSVGYLLKVLEAAARSLAWGGRIFLGDVRHLGLLEAQARSIEIQRSQKAPSKTALQARVRRRVEQESELLIAPAFFAALRAHLPRLRGVEARPKLGRFHNELNSYRYDVVLYLDAANVRAMPDDAWIDGTDLDLDGLRSCLAARPELLGVSALANRRIVAGGLELDAVVALGEQLGYRVVPSWLVPHPDGAFDVVLERCEAPSGSATGEASIWEPVLTPEPAEPTVLTNDPLADARRGWLVARLRDQLGQVLPSFMWPAALVVLDELPRLPSGKVDRAALRDREIRRDGTFHKSPSNEVEARLARIWEEVLGIEHIGVDDDFFALGGHSLLATQVLSRLRQHYPVDLPLREIFEHPTIAGLAVRIAQIEADHETTSQNGEDLEELVF